MPAVAVRTAPPMRFVGKLKPRVIVPRRTLTVPPLAPRVLVTGHVALIYLHRAR